VTERQVTRGRPNPVTRSVSGCTAFDGQNDGPCRPQPKRGLGSGRWGRRPRPVRLGRAAARSRESGTNYAKRAWRCPHPGPPPCRTGPCASPTHAKFACGVADTQKRSNRRPPLIVSRRHRGADSPEAGRVREHDGDGRRKRHDGALGRIPRRPRPLPGGMAPGAQGQRRAPLDRRRRRRAGRHVRQGAGQPRAGPRPAQAGSRC